MRSLFKKLNFTASSSHVEGSLTPRPNHDLDWAVINKDEIFIKDTKFLHSKKRDKEPNIREKYQEIDNQLVLISLDLSQNSIQLSHT